MTREEAISRLRGLVLYDEDEEALAVLAPEISESHDETMRKMAINAVCSPDAQDCLKSWGIDPNDVIAWLEKKKRPTQIEKNYIRTIKSLISDFLYGKDHIDREYYQKIVDWLDGRHVEPQYTETIEVKDGKMSSIKEVMGFKVGDTVRLKDGDGRPHIIKAFEKDHLLHGYNYYTVIFEDSATKGHICPGDKNPTNMEKLPEVCDKTADAIKDILKDKDSALAFLKGAGIVDENGELAELYRPRV